MRFLFLVFLLLPGLALAQPCVGPCAPVAPVPGKFDNTTASSGIVFTQNVDVNLTPCSYTVPAGLLQNPKDKIRWWAAGNMVSSTDIKTVTARYGATAGTGSSGLNVGAESGATASSLSWWMNGIITKISTNSQRVSAGGQVQNSGSTAAALSGSANAVDANANLLMINGKSANATPPNDSVICNELHVWFEAGAPLP